MSTKTARLIRDRLVNIKNVPFYQKLEVGRGKLHMWSLPQCCDAARLCSRCAPAATMLQTNGDLKRKWTWAVYWLNDELERVRERERDSVSVKEGAWEPVCVWCNAGVPAHVHVCLFVFCLHFFFYVVYNYKSVYILYLCSSTDSFRFKKNYIMHNRSSFQL